MLKKIRNIALIAMGAIVALGVVVGIFAAPSANLPPSSNNASPSAKPGAGLSASPTASGTKPASASPAASSASTASSAAPASASAPAAPAPGGPTPASPAPASPAPASPPKIPAIPVPAPAVNSAQATLATLLVKGRASKAGYSRKLFAIWTDTDHNGCDARNDILRRDLINWRVKPNTHGCVVLTGLLHDPYSGQDVKFVRGEATSPDVQIDHVVALSDAWQTGAQEWTPERRAQFGSDPLNLLAVSGAQNSQKSDSNAASWLPANKAFRCQYVARQIAVKSRYGLAVVQPELEAAQRVLASCAGIALPNLGDDIPLGSPEQTATAAEVAAANTLSRANSPAPANSAPLVNSAPPASPAPLVNSAPPISTAPLPGASFQNCADVRNRLGRPISRDEPGFQPRFDRDGDGVGCE